MESLLKADFFKNEGFSTKASGIEFMKTNKTILECMNDCENKLENIKLTLTEKMHSKLNEKGIREEKEKVLIRLKQIKNEQIQNKKKMSYEKLKNSLKKELLAEIETMEE